MRKYISLGTVTSLIIKANWTSIESSAFYGRSNLVSITLPTTVTSIGFAAFQGCTSLTSVNLPDCLTTINSEMFYGCKSLTTITIPASVTTIGSYAFYDSGITSIDLPENLEDIGDWAFYRTPLKSITIPSGVKWIREHTFSLCRDLTTVVSSKPISVFSQAFEYCSSLVDLPPIDWIDPHAFQYCTSLKTVTFYQSLKKIRYEAFKNCTSLSHITLPENVTNIESNAFSGCTALETVNLSSRVGLTNYVFQDCSKLPTITIPSNASLGYSTFSGCSSLKSVYVYKDNPEGIDANYFEGCPEDMVVYIPQGSLSLYRITPGWMNLKNLVEFDPTAITCLKGSEGISIKSDGGQLTVSGLNDGEQIQVYDVSGVLIGKATATAGTAIVNVSASARFVVLKVGNESLKVKL